MLASVSELFLLANPPDEFFPNYSQQFAEAEAERFTEWAKKEGIGWYPSPHNVKVLQEWLSDKPVTLRNLQIGFYWLRSMGRLEQKPVESEPEPEPQQKYSRPVVKKVLKSVDEQQAVADETKRLRELDNSPRGRKRVDVGRELRREYQQSLQQNKNGGKKPHMSLGEARAMISKQHPDIPVGSPRYNEFVSWLMYDSE